MRSVGTVLIFILIAQASWSADTTLAIDAIEAADTMQVADTTLAIDAIEAADTMQVADTTAPVVVDTVIYQPTFDTALALQVTNPTDFEASLTQQPTVALFRSMFVPGWGQFGNKRYVKAALIATLETWLIISAIDHGRKASDFRSQWDAEGDIPTRQWLYSEYLIERDQRNKYMWFAGITIFLSMFDAYVDAHLSGSPKDERNNRIDLRVDPDDKGGAKAALTYSF
jgi:hypothetical protein